MIHQLAWQNGDCSKHHYTTEQMSLKMLQHQLLGEDSVKLAYITEQMSRNHCEGRKIMSIGSCVSHRDRTTEQWNKVLWTEESKFEISESNKMVSIRRRFGERAANPCITPTVKRAEWFVMVCVYGGVANWNIGDLHEMKG